MIKGITIENFKGIGEPGIHLDLKPITMLFGTNSAGKSTIFHALLYAYEVLVNRNLNPDRTTLGGDAVELGGFATFIHDHDLDRGVTLEFDLDMSNVNLHRDFPIEELEVEYTLPSSQVGEEEQRTKGGGRRAVDVSTIGLDIWSAKIRIRVSWDYKNQEASVTEYAVSLNDEPLGRITYDIDTASKQLEDLNLRHSLFAWPNEVSPEHGPSVGILDCLYPSSRSELETIYFEMGTPTTSEPDDEGHYTHIHHGNTAPDLSEVALREIGEPFGALTYLLLLQRDRQGSISVRKIYFYDSDEDEWDPGDIEAISGLYNPSDPATEPPSMNMPELEDALPNWEEPLPLRLQVEYLNAEIDPSGRYETAFRDLLARLLVGPGKLLTQELKTGRYIGPLREIPPRDHQAPLTPDHSRWANGLAAWDLLYDAREWTVEKVNDWLSRDDRLGTGYSIQVKRFRELESDGFVVRSLRQDRYIDDIEQITKAIDEIPEKKRIFIRDEATLFEVEPQDIAVGITQLVPIVVAAVTARDRVDNEDPRRRFSLMEQPELHNHPAVEVGLGDLFTETLAKDQEYCSFILETHGEHLILRMLRRIGQTTDGRLPEGHRGLKPKDIAVYHVNRTPNGVEVSHLRIDDTGEFVDDWPQGFFTERGEELFG